MNSIDCGEKAFETSASSSVPSSFRSFLAFVSMVRVVPVATEYFSSSTGLPSLLMMALPSESTFLTQFLRSTPMPPVTPTVVWKIGEIPLVPATIGAMLTNGT